MNKILNIQAAVAILGSTCVYLILSTQPAISFSAGAALVFSNLFVLLWVWDKILNKKLVALAVLVIVFKYAILGFIIYKILSYPSISTAWFGAGLSTLVVTALIYAFSSLVKQEDKAQ